MTQAELTPGHAGVEKPPIIEYLKPGENRYPLRTATVDDFDKIVTLFEHCSEWIQQLDGSNGMWAGYYPDEVTKKAGMLKDIVEGRTFVTEKEDGSIAGSITISYDLNEMLWDEKERQEPSVHIARLMTRRDLPKEDCLGKELIWWACEQGYRAGCVYARLEVDDSNTHNSSRLHRYYGNDCDFDQLPSKTWGPYPASARFERSLIDWHPGTGMVAPVARPDAVIDADNPFSTVADLDPFTAAAWRRGKFDDESPRSHTLMGTLVNGNLRIPGRDRLYYRDDIAQINTSFLGEVSQQGGLSGVSTATLIMSAFRSRILDRPIMEDQQLTFDYLFRDISPDPINIHDMLTEQEQIDLFCVIGLARFLANINLSPSPDTERIRGKQYLEAVDGQLYEWNTAFEAIERPVKTREDCAKAWQIYDNSWHDGPGVLTEGIFDGHSLQLDGMQITLLQPDKAAIMDPSAFTAIPGKSDTVNAVVRACYQPPRKGQLGPQPYVPEANDQLMVRLSMPVTRPGDTPRIQAELFKVDRPGIERVSHSPK